MSAARQGKEDIAPRPTARPVLTSKTILQKLFPSHSVQDLAVLSREQMLEQLQPQRSSSPARRSADSEENEEAEQDILDDAQSLKQLQAFPVSGTAAASRQQSPSTSNGVTDDINALALSVKTASSYLGISSVVAVLRIILLLDPESKAFATSGHANPNSSLDSSGGEGPDRRENAGEASLASASADTRRELTIWDEVPAINAFFTYVHPQIPLLAEDTFRSCYMSRKRDDARWNLLLNAVLAMGSVAASTAKEKTHRVFYERARQYLVVDTFGYAHLETVQALTILGGMYLHYVQQPNLANFLIGATFRMATTLGLHRDYSEYAKPSRAGDISRVTDLRRRIWWSLCSLDACNSNSLGRPTLGRLGPGHNVRKPEVSGSSNPVINTLLRDSIDYCIISTRMDDYLADRLVLSSDNRSELDNAFLSWLNRDSVQDFEPSSETPAGVVVAMNVMRWRCQSARVFIYRPSLLWYAMRRESMQSISATKREAILSCRTIAAELIEDISSTWQVPSPCLMAGWPATWLIYQTSMVPLLSLFCDIHSPEIIATSTRLVEKVIATLSALENWSCTARRSLEVVTRLYNASRAYYARMQQHEHSRPGELRQTRGSDTAAVRYDMADPQEVMTQGTPATHLSGSAVEDMLIGNFFEGLSWLDSHDQMIQGVGDDLAFLDYYDI
ncbi:fungal specific transcription factor domain-containing protein [Sarocladium implicatum]|nr:fungal specific transcription factor domain-containing protein [Sarocladium implicatum]